MFDQKLKATLKGLKLVSVDEYHERCQRVVVSFETKLDEKIAGGLGDFARASFEAIEARKAKRAILPMEDVAFNCKLSGKRTQRSIKECTGSAITLKRGKADDAEPTIAWGFVCHWDDEDLVWLAHQHGETLSVELQQRQMSLPGAE
jgi:hypothetical protein